MIEHASTATQPVRSPGYLETGNGPFAAALKARVDAYFNETGKTRRGGPEITAKVIAILSLYVGLYLLMLFQPWHPAMTLVFAVLFGLVNVLIVFCIGHDAAHNALFDDNRLNRIFSYAFNLVGASGYLWNITHNQIHHTYPNVAGYDTDIHQQAPLIRVSPTVPRRWYHRYQPYYAPLLYMMYSLFLLFQKDYQDIGLLPKKDSPLLRNRKHATREFLILLLSKVGYYTLTIVIPYIVLDLPLLTFLGGYLLVHACMSIFLSVVLIPVHMVDESPFARVSSDGTIHDTWMMHVIRNTVDYSRASRLANVLFGGLNTHLIHHLFPGICHVHYIALSDVLAKTAREFGVRYHSVTMAEAIHSHFRLLRRMGNP